jgi:predicted lipoprotein with Yx(FWY)xxD motif
VGHTWSIITVDPTGAYQYAAPGQTEGLRVWAYRGRPVYTYARDEGPGDMNGHNIAALGSWGYYMLRVPGTDKSSF